MALGSNECLWKMLVLRDFKGYLLADSIADIHISMPQYKNEIVIENETKEESLKDGIDPELDPLTLKEQEILGRHLKYDDNWYESYKKFTSLINYNGEWIDMRILYVYRAF